MKNAERLICNMLNTTGGNTLLDASFLLNKAKIGQNMKVADLGCGVSGHFIYPSSAMVGKNGVIYAVDILKTILSNINKRVKQNNIENIKTVWTDLEIFGATKIESNSLDVALLINTLYQSHRRANIIRESVRMLKKNGKLLVVEWKNIAIPFGPPVEERVKQELLKTNALKMGLQLEDEFEAGQYHYGMLFIKS